MPSGSLSDVREFILRAQRVLNMTDSELAEMLGTVRTTISNWRSGRHEPSGRAVLAIVDRLIEQNASGRGLPPSSDGT